LQEFSSGGAVYDIQYNHGSGGSSSIYTRTINVTDVTPTASADEKKVTVTVSWREKSVVRNFVVIENIYNYEQ
jgi:hypothetical protein